MFADNREFTDNTTGNAAADDDGDEFARLLAGDERTATAPTPGQRVTGVIVQIGELDAFVDCGGRQELSLPTAELQDEDGKQQYAVGDEITAHVIGKADEMSLTLAIDLRQAGWRTLTEAHAAGTPIRGKVHGTNKGGFTVALGRFRAFCPFSQMDLRRIEAAETYLDREFEFKLLELGEEGRNLVVSRRALLQDQRDSEAAETRVQIVPGAVLDGEVSRLVPYGAFVDLGGIEGLLHISEIAHERLEDPADFLQEGQTIRVKVLEVQNLGEPRRERVSLSLKALAEDPWPMTVNALPIGRDVPGKVMRVVDFGAFVELLPGIEGLVHISELADRRVDHPHEVVKAGDEITVRILDVDPERRRIALSLRQADPGDD